ncbi:MAG: hypothetical protein IT365_15945 [Candidatus Hydrogenedentes bacterium]|nr:hypothetical protein [Candidatus Hydrogenedentota bacterium]
MNRHTPIPSAALLAAILSSAIMANTALAQEPKLPEKIKRVDIVHMSHTDVGFTDHPAVCREQQMRYLDIAIDGVLATESAAPAAQFSWTAEAALTVDDWWQKNTPERRQDLIRAIKTGRLEITALAMNQTPTLNADQWKTTLHWLPEEVWNAAPPRTGIQNDVNGFPRAGALAMLNRNVANLFMGINATNGKAPFQVPMAFWWKMPDGHRLFVWLGESYPLGFYYFFADSWRRGPVPESTDTRYRPPRRGGEFYPTDETALRKAQARLCERLGQLEARGYDFPSLPLSVTNEWRMDNDPPFLGLADFVAAWNHLKLEPELRLTTVSQAIEDLKPHIADRLPEYQGEFTDWWVNGCASGPREVSASRRAKRNLTAALSPVWGEAPDANTLLAANAMLRDLCLFDEHTWGSADSIGQPHDIDTWAQFNEKARAAYHPLARSKMLLAQRARTAIYPQEYGFYVANTAPAPWSGWVTMKATALRDKVEVLVDPQTGALMPMEIRAGYAQFTAPENESQLTFEADHATVADNVPGQARRFWMESIKPVSTVRLIPTDKKANPAPTDQAPAIEVDAHGWPTSVQWPGMSKPLFTESPGDFVSVELTEFSGRWKYNEILQSRSEERRKEALKETAAVAAGSTTVESNPHTTVYTQLMTHPRLKWLKRTLEVYHSEPRAQLTVRLYRLSSELPEWFYIGCALPTGDTIPTVSCGGVPFVPFEDQLPHTCRDYMAIDGWADYETADGHWLWITRDAPVVSFGGPQTLKHLEDAPPNPNRAYALVFDNTWMTNFVADSHGIFEFRFDLVWKEADAIKSVKDAADIAETVLSEPQLIIQPALQEDPIFMERLHKP